MRFVFIFIALVIAWDCAERDLLEDIETRRLLGEIARAANPVLEHMRPAALEVASPLSNPRRVVDACTRNDLAVVALGVHSESFSGKCRRCKSYSTPLQARWLLQRFWRKHCTDDAAPDFERCVSNCRELWGSLAEGVDKLRNDARILGVDIVSLKP